MAMDYKLLKVVRSGNKEQFLELLQAEGATKIAILGDDATKEVANSLLGVTCEGNTALHITATHGHLQLAEEIWHREKSLLMAVNKKLNTPLHCAARTGDYQMVALLIKFAKDVGENEAKKLLRAKNRDGETALHGATQNGHSEVTEKLMEEDPELASMVNDVGISPLYLAVTSGSLYTVQALTKRQEFSSLTSSAGPQVRNALHAAVVQSPEITKELVGWKSALTKEADDFGRTLHDVASHGDRKTVELLLNPAYLPDTSGYVAAYLPDTSGSKPIHVAASRGNVEIIDELITHCPDTDELLDNQGRNFLHVAVEIKQLKVVRYVCKKQELEKLMNDKDHDGNTPLQLAVAHKEQGIVDLLMQHKRVRLSMMNNTTGTGDSSLRQRIAMDYKLLKVVQSGSKDQLLQFLQPEGATKVTILGDDVTEEVANSLLGVTAEGNTALHIAASHGHLELAGEICHREKSLLIAVNKKLNAPLHCAARTGGYQIVAVIIQFAKEVGENEAKKLLKARNRDGETALHEATQNGHPEVTEKLMEEDPELASMVNDAGISPLYLAVMSGSLHTVQALTKRPQLSSLISSAGPQGQTALHAAVFQRPDITYMYDG